jgi:predicted Co/Zn/Cd cation transporter (cation efflux family)
MVKVGRDIFVTVNVLLPGGGPISSVADLDSIRQNIDSELKGLHPEIIVYTLFTGRSDRVPETSQEDIDEG